jgi:hypothetical protein
MCIIELTRYNFSDWSSKVISSIQDADFISIDSELTGLVEERYQPIIYNNEVLERKYVEMAHSAKAFALIQFGIAIFKWDPKERIYEWSAFSFYLSPNTNNSDLFSIQWSSLEFLTENNFDFNRVIKEGIMYDRIVGPMDSIRRDTFESIIHALIISKKPILGHCCMLDLLHMYQKTINDLPMSWKEWRDKMNAYFPFIADTKYLSKSLGLDGKRLSELFDYCNDKFYDTCNISFSSSKYIWELMTKELQSKSESSIGGRMFHDAAYDAYCCARVFIIFAHARASKSPLNAISLSERYMQNYLNRCYIRTNPNDKSSSDQCFCFRDD